MSIKRATKKATFFVAVFSKKLGDVFNFHYKLQLHPYVAEELTQAPLV